MKHFIVGTAGHVDHGKTVLVKALTGKDTDRLKEEKERGISIELGFAPFKLPSGIMAGVVDVPGHERFIKNMLAGVGGIDMVLLVVAADEGIMPQTREHLGIIDLLQVPVGIIVITKIDLVEEEWLELVKEEVRELVQGTVLENAQIAEVSGITGKGIPELVDLIDSIAGQMQERPVTGRARMSVDRVFSVTGFGTVVTGTLAEGRLEIGDTVEILPHGLSARVRGLQVHNKKVEAAEAGQRVAINIAGIECEQVDRGNVVTVPGLLKTSHRLDIRIKLLADAGKPLANRTRIRVHVGTTELLARVILLETEELEPGDTGLAQLECEEPAVAARGDRLIIRSYSPMHTIAGGKVIDPQPLKHKRFDRNVIEDLKTREKGTPKDLVRQYMAFSTQVAFTGEDFIRGLGMDADVFRKTMDEMVSEGQVRQFTSDSKPYYILSSLFDRKAVQLTKSLEDFHNQFPLRNGISKEETRSRNFTGLNSKLFNALMEIFEAEGIVRLSGESIARSGFEPRPRPEQEKLFDKIGTRFLEGGFQTPGWDEIITEFKLGPGNSDEILNYFLSAQVLVKLEDNVLLHRQNLEQAKEMVVRFLKENSEMSLGEARDLLKTSRKFALPIMNYLDKEKVTRRVDDKRVLY